MKVEINLLPPHKKEEQKNVKTARVILKIGGMAIVSLVILFIFLQFCLKFISIEEKNLKEEVARFEKNEFYKRAKTAQDFLRDYDQKAKVIKKGLESQNDYGKVIAEVNSILPDNIYLSEFSIAEKKVNLKGISKNRESLLQLQDRLEKSEIFAQVESPISNFVENKDVEFSFVLLLN